MGQSRPRPHPVVQRDPFSGPPKPFSFKYGVVDAESGSNFDHAQQQDSTGVVTGEYRVNLPDGRVQIVSYTASAEKGYVANVRYEGTAKYPETPKPGKKKRSQKHKRKVKNPYMKFKEKQRRHGESPMPKVVSLSPKFEPQQGPKVVPKSLKFEP